ncbi:MULTISPECIES: saccharopine dehydrogenase family protein [Haloarcula]|uniref:saccharopine dehydrogenase family protein n=1 Tax=Haloarcula TaxID=2237 RepID=UPI0023ED5464|nr:saccharopine dehydrogenase NADP-binding domain-containing protein [Halomicroarcula sp. XH51]
MSRHTSSDVVVWGATGFTGRLAAEHLARAGGDDLSWTVAGRSPSKLESLREDLADIDPGLADREYLVGDATDRESLAAIAEETDVVCAAVGPYAEYGTPMVEACLDAGTDYCDLTGELQWMRETVERYHERAVEDGTRIVHACGFDSVPSDLGTLLVQTHAMETSGAPCSTVRANVALDGGGFSGGTAASMVDLYEVLEDDPSLAGALADPHALVPEGHPDPRSAVRGALPQYDREAGTWTAPFFMAKVNEKVVHRSNALRGYPWGRSFAYHESMVTGDGPAGAALAGAVTGGLVLLDGIMSVGPLRRQLERYVLPDPGEGPSRQAIERGGFEVRLRGTGAAADGGDVFTVEGRIAANRDAYGTSGVLIGEAARCLANGAVDSPLAGGVLTPASGIGLPLVERLRAAGLTISVDGW